MSQNNGQGNCSYCRDLFPLGELIGLENFVLHGHLFQVCTGCFQLEEHRLSRAFDQDVQSNVITLPAIPLSLETLEEWLKPLNRVDRKIFLILVFSYSLQEPDDSQVSIKVDSTRRRGVIPYIRLGVESFQKLQSSDQAALLTKAMQIIPYSLNF